MPSEIRHIVFGKQELAEALDAYKGSIGHELPAGEIVSCMIETEERIGVRLAYAGDDDAAIDEVTVSPSTVAAAMLAFCAACHIPVPQNSDKSLQMFGDNLGLSIRIASTTVSFSETIEMAKPLQDILQAS